MKINELFDCSFKALSRQLNHQPTHDIVSQMQSTECTFCRSLVDCGYLTLQQMQQAAALYRLGRTRQGGVVFWQIDQSGALRDGKVMFYRTDCHRDHDRKPSWASYLLKSRGLLPKEWEPRRCLFGLHLLNGDCRVAVVESEKTAVIMSQLLPQYVWLACGGLTMLTAALLSPLSGCSVVLFPDTDEEGRAYQLWCSVAEESSKLSGRPVYVSDLLERHASANEKVAKIDIADYVLAH